VLLEGVGHFPMLEQPARFQTALRRLVDELVAP
jgi:pimeloyl-ACP methyl ester carboxylesterase